MRPFAGTPREAVIKALGANTRSTLSVAQMVGIETAKASMILGQLVRTGLVEQAGTVMLNKRGRPVALWRVKERAFA